MALPEKHLDDLVADSGEGQAGGDDCSKSQAGAVKRLVAEDSLEKEESAFLFAPHAQGRKQQEEGSSGGI